MDIKSKIKPIYLVGINEIWLHKIFKIQQKTGQKQFPTLLASKKQLKHGSPGKAISHTNQISETSQTQVTSVEV